MSQITPRVSPLFRLNSWNSTWQASHATTMTLLRAGTVLSVALLGVFVVRDTATAAAVINRLGSIHALFGAGLISLLLFAGLGLFSGLLSSVLAVAEALPQFVMGVAMMGILPFAQASDPSAAQPESPPEKSVARSEMQVGVYMGKSHSPNSDVALKSPDGTDLVLRDIVWKPESFKPSPYYGGRGIDWNSKVPTLGLMVDFTHAKATAIRSQTVSLVGKHKGEDVPASAPFETIFRKLEFTHGLNFLTLNGVYRATGLHRRIVPYAGFGIGLMVPHVEAWRAGQAKKDIIHEAQLTGISGQVIGGLEWRMFKSDRRSLLTEYKLTYSTNEVTLKDTGTVSTNIWVHQFNFGGYYTPWRVGDAAAR